MPDCCPTCGQPKLPLLRTLDLAGKLTHRQMQVARMLSLGLKCREIARMLGCSEDTAWAHCYNISQRLGLHGQKEIVLEFRRSEARAAEKAMGAGA